MTYIYEWFRFPKVFSVICPNCQGECNCSEIPITKNFNGNKMTFNSGKLSKNFKAKLNCSKCGYTNEKIINWEKDAYWKFNIKGKILWAWNLEHAIAILEFIKSKNRKQTNRELPFSFLHIPEFFKLAKNRETVIRKITKTIKRNDGKK